MIRAVFVVMWIVCAVVLVAAVAGLALIAISEWWEGRNDG